MKFKNNKKNLSKTLLFCGSGFLGPNILERYPEIVCVMGGPNFNVFDY